MGFLSKSSRLFVLIVCLFAWSEVRGQDSTTPLDDLLVTTDGTTESQTVHTDLLMTTDGTTIELTTIDTTTGTPDPATEAVCLGVEDCAGVCNGDAEEDCAGTCNGVAEEDCSGLCAGSAFINDCNECVGGETRRANDFGADKCGNCRADAGYVEVWDCFETCDGNATIDDCGECVGGDTGSSEDANDGRLDCRGICDGGWETENCSYCEPPSSTSYPYGSKYKDCTEECIKPGRERAFINDCDVCVGGNSGNATDAGENVCGQCENDPDADPTSCEGCDGVANSGLVDDACGVCDGDGTGCVGVSRVTPNVFPDNAVEVAITGAGFTDGTTLKCIFTTGGTDTEGAMVSWTSTQAMVCAADLSAGTYTVTVERDGVKGTDVTADVTVYADIEITSISPTTFTTNSTLAGEIEEIVVTATTSGAFSSLRDLDNSTWDVLPVLIGVADDGTTVELEGMFVSDTAIRYYFQYPEDSVRYRLMPTINGETSLALATDPTNVTVSYQAPQVEDARFSDEGAGLIIEFDLGVDYEDFTSCDDIFSNAAVLGTDAECKWRTPKDLVIVIGKGDDLIEIGDSLTFETDAVKAFRQDYALAASGSVTVAGPSNPLIPTAVISGSALLPSCGNVELNGRKSTGGGGRSMSYEWSVTSSGDTSGFASYTLNSSLLEVNGTEMDADTEYDFSLVVTNFLGGNDTSYFTVERSALALPQVTVTPQGIDPNDVKVADSFSITAEVTFYSACVPAGDTEFEWSCNNTEVPLNLKTQNSRTLFVDANSMPGGEAIEFTVKVYKSSAPGAYTETSVTVLTVRSELVAIISGAAEYSVGRDSGIVTIDGSLTYDPDEEARPWIYTFECTQITDVSACWSYDPDHIGELIINDTNIDGAVLSFDALGFQADKEYAITLNARKLTRTASASVIISAVSGNPPKVVFDELQDDGVVKDTDVIFLSAKVYGADADDIISWSTVDTEDGKGFIDLSDPSNLLTGFPKILDTSSMGYMIALMGIQGGVGERGTEYAFQVDATNDAGNTGTAKAYLSVRSGPTSCEFTVEDYEALSETGALVENCVTDADSQPLKYQLLTSEGGTKKAVTDAVAEPEIKFVGKPAFAGSSRTYVIEVCNKFVICSQYEAVSTVSPKSSFTAAEKTAYKTDQVDLPKYKGNYQNAFGNLGLLADVENGSSRRRRDVSRVRRVAADTTTETAADQLELIELTLSRTVLTTSSAQLLIDNCASIQTNDMTVQDQDELLDYFITMIAVFTDAEETMPDASSDIILEKVGEISDGLDPAYYSSVLDKCKSVQETLLGSLTSDLVLGGGVTEVVDSDVTLGIQKALLDEEFVSKTTGDSVGIDFGSELASMFGAVWTCSSGSACSGVTVKVSHYNTGVDVYSTSNAANVMVAADIIEIILADPDSDETLNVTGLSSPVELTFPLTVGLSNVAYSCVFWDTTGNDWSSTDITTAEVGGDVVCSTTHLTAFTVLGTTITTTVPATDGTTTDAATTIGSGSSSGSDNTTYIIIGAVLGSLVLIAIIVVIAVVCMKMQKGKRVGPEDEEGYQNPGYSSNEREERESSARQRRPSTPRE